MIDLIRALLACNHSDPNRNRAGAGRWVTVNVPAELWQRLAAAVAEPTAPARAQPGAGAEFIGNPAEGGC